MEIDHEHAEIDQHEEKNIQNEQPDWLPVKFEPASAFANMYISRLPASGKDVFVDDGKGGFFQPFDIERQALWKKSINHVNRSISINFIRRMHFDYPDWSHLINFALDDHSETLRSFLLSQSTLGKPLWAKVRGHSDYIVNRSGTLIVGGRLVIRSPSERTDGYFQTKLAKKDYLFHRVVWEAFNEEPIQRGFSIDHIDGDPSNNCLDNLRLSNACQQRNNQKRWAENTSNDREIEVWTPDTNVWTTFPRKSEFFQKFPRVSVASLSNLLCGVHKKTSDGLMIRYKEINQLYDVEGTPEVWIQLHGTNYYVSNMPDFPDNENPTKSKGARFSEIMSRGVRVRVTFVPRKSGYVSVKDTSGKGCALHRLVYIAFKGPIPSGYDIDHIDGQKSNNFWMNLQALSKKAHVEKTHGRPVSINSIRYPSIQAAAVALGKSASSLACRLKRGRDPSIEFAPRNTEEQAAKKRRTI